MRSQSAYLVLSTLALSANAAPQPRFLRRQASPASLPQDASDPDTRAAGVAERNEGFVYGPSLIGDAAFFPNGTLGNARTQADYDIWSVDRAEIDKLIEEDVVSVQEAIVAVSHGMVQNFSTPCS